MGQGIGLAAVFGGGFCCVIIFRWRSVFVFPKNLPFQLGEESAIFQQRNRKLRIYRLSLARGVR